MSINNVHSPLLKTRARSPQLSPPFALSPALNLKGDDRLRPLLCSTISIPRYRFAACITPLLPTAKKGFPHFAYTIIIHCTMRPAIKLFYLTLGGDAT